MAAPVPTSTPHPSGPDRANREGPVLDIGVDLGTTRTVVARADRGNYPVLTFNDTAGDPQEYLP